MSFPRLASLFALIVLLGSHAAYAADAAFKPPAAGKFKIFLLVGQSNMAGRGKIEEEDLKPHPRIVKLDKAGNWVPAIDPLHYDKPNVAGVGLGLTFARRVAEACPDDVIGLVPCAVGGTSIDQWSPAKEKDLYAEAVRRAKIALKDGTLAGILWHQGEADSKKADVYTEKAKTLFAAFRKDLASPDVPIVFGAIGEFHAGNEAINKTLRELPKVISRSAFAESTGLKDKGDKTHFDAASYHEFGRRYAAKWLELAKK